MSILKKFIVTIFLFCVLLGGLNAAYPDKKVYSDDWISGVYIGLNVGPSVSNTFSVGSQSDYIGLYTPTNMLSSSFTSAVLGANVWALRGELEWLYIYSWTNIVNNSINYDTGAYSSSWFPHHGQEVLNNAFAANLYYDMKFISHSFYPYIGFGAGIGKQEYLMVDLTEQPNGLGEQYQGSAVVPFGQFMLGLKYDTKIIKSSFTLEYRLTSVASVNVDPLNDGIHDIINPDICTPRGLGVSPSCIIIDGVTPTTASKNAKSVYHSIVLGFKYYLY